MTMTTHHDRIRAIIWRDEALELLDQRRLPHEIVYLRLESASAVAAAITDMVVRGAPAIGITAAYGVVLAARATYQQDAGTWPEHITPLLKQLAQARPTAVNLGWALARMQQRIAEVAPIAADPTPVLLAEAQAIHAEDIAANQRMGQLGAELLGTDKEEPIAVLTHCNTGSLATGGYGTALGVIRSGFAQRRIQQVYADETRPWLQGSRLTAWELVQDQIPVTLLADGAAAYLMKQGHVRWVIVGADRIAANGDVANKIGTYQLAVAARHHGVRMMVVAPTSTFDRHLASGAEIPIEQRTAEEVLSIAGHPIAAAGAQAWNPVFDVTPAALVDAIVTERGVILAPTPERVARVLRGA